LKRKILKIIKLWSELYRHKSDGLIFWQHGSVVRSSTGSGINLLWRFSASAVAVVDRY
jgi:hypothetical protein